MRGARALVAALLLVAGVGCGTAGSPAGSGANEARGRQPVTVFAAASLKTTFPALGKTFEAAHPGASVAFSFGGSSDLVSQLQNGAPADVFASADTANMDKAVASTLVAGSPVPFATNTLTIAVPPGNPARVRDLRDLAKPAAKVVLCAPAVPCGAAARRVQQLAGVTLHPVSEESSVTDVLNKVTTGQADAGLVYVTDVRGAGTKVVGVPIPQARQAVLHYPIAALTGSTHPDLARDFVALVTRPQGQQVLRAAGFGGP